MGMWADIEARYRPGYAPPEYVKVLVAGLPRSGTYFLTELLRRHGVPTGHECIFALRSVRDPPTYRHAYGDDPVIEVSGFAVPWLEDCRRAGLKVVQYLRHPVPCCTSNVNYFSEQHKQVTWEETCATFLAWHQVLERVADHTVYLERLPEGVEKIFQLAGREVQISPSILAASPRGTSTPGGPWTWADLPPELQEFARRHGYTE